MKFQISFQIIRLNSTFRFRFEKMNLVEDSPRNESLDSIIGSGRGNGISYVAESGWPVPDDGLIAAVRQHTLTHTRTLCRRSSVGVCDSEVMFVASCRLIQGAIRVKVHRIDVHTRPVSLSFPLLFSPFFLSERRVTIDRVCRV